MLVRILLVLAAVAPPTLRGAETGFFVLDQPDGQAGLLNGPVMALERSAGGQLLVGANQLDVYDGATWQHLDVPGARRILALASTARLPSSESPADERLWLAGDNAIGYLSPAPTGAWRYTSLADRYAVLGFGEATEIHHIFPTREGAIFVARSRVLSWDGTRFRSWEVPSQERLYAFELEGRILAYQSGVGLLQIDAAGPHVVMPEGTLPVHQPLVALLRGQGGGELAIFHSQAYLLNGGQWKRLDALSALVADRTAMSAVALQGGQVAIRTAYGGVLIAQADGSVAGVIDVPSGLRENNVASLLGDQRGNLWIGGSNVVTRVAGASYASLFDQRDRLYPGAIRSVSVLDGRAWVVTAQRVYRLDASRLAPSLTERVPMFWPAIDDVALCDGHLWLAGWTGLWRIDDFQPVHALATPDDVTLLTTLGDLPHGLIYARAGALFAFRGADAAPRPVPLGATLDGPPLSRLEDAQGRLWVATESGHIQVFRYRPTDGTLRTEAHFEPGRGLPKGTARPLLAQIGGEVVVFAENGFLVFRDGRFQDVPELAPFLGFAASARADGSIYWLAACRSLGESAPLVLLRVREDPASHRFDWTPLDAPGLDRIGRRARLFLTGGEQPLLWAGGEGALLRLEVEKLMPAPSAPRTVWERLRIDSDRDAPLGGAAAVFPSRTQRLEFSYAAGIEAAAGGGALFQTRLSGVETAWTPAPAGPPRREFTGLASGRYVFAARVTDAFGRTGPAAEDAFTIEPPWYRRASALALWAVLGALGVGAVVKWRVRRLARQAELLNQLVAERTRELSLSNTARAEFLDSISHEIRRPLNGILTMTQRLVHSPLASAEHEPVRQLELASESLLRVFNEVLSYSQLEYGAVPLQERVFTLRDVISAAQAESAADGALRLELPPEAADRYLGDDGKLRSIVGNFLANAVKYAPGSPCEIHVAVTPVGAGLAEVLIEVVDGGPGVPPEEQELIFKRFVRGSRAKREHVPGTGIGLATCRVMARLMGGSVGVESPAEHARRSGWAGPGALFFVRVPLRRVASLTG